MKENELKILNLIREYVEDVQFFTELMNKQSENIKGYQVYKSIGYFDKEETLYYSFHGIGIYLRSPEKKVDFDFYSKGRTDAFQPWSILKYIKSNSKFNRDLGNFDEIDEIYVILKASFLWVF